MLTLGGSVETSDSLPWVGPGMVVEVTGAVEEGGSCDYWPVEVRAHPSAGNNGDRLFHWAEVGTSGVVSEVVFQITGGRPMTFEEWKAAGYPTRGALTEQPQFAPLPPPADERSSG